ncbi:tetratricopeptide repeat protein [Catenovulum sp. 2E275]|uniref:heme biosynthesis HemY N-terminal domain-containing protein n=1 Tax=Catenovulum sp. 2E275 TaxID=2980497 RepID=UPI0021CE8429|nr:heme biosynthesis HemY N-terminal domain-containing protein [Catenovulum sp. 2E275]MCU4675082.1 tetratricopeptide repeat protein [Catenovulum sp. 2E275]
MIKIILFFCFACALIALGAVVVEEKGYVLISVANWTWETSLFGFVLMLVALYIAFVIIKLIIRSVFNVRKNWREWRTDRKHSRSLKTLQGAIEALLNNQWQKAEQLSLKHAKHSPIASSHYLIAAEAARQQNHNDDSSVYLLRAQQTGSETDKQFALCKSLMQEGKAEQAIEKCEVLLTAEPKHSENLLLLARLYHQTGQFEKQRELLSRVKRYTDISQAEFNQLTLAAFAPLFKAASEQKDLKSLQLYYKAMHKLIEPIPQSTQLYLLALHNAGFEKEVESNLIKLFEQNISDSNLALLHQLELNQPLKLTAWIEKQIKRQPDNAQLKVLLAITACKNNDLQLAQQAMESALQQSEQTANPQNYGILADIYQQQNNTTKAIACYQKALALTSQKA